MKDLIIWKDLVNVTTSNNGTTLTKTGGVHSTWDTGCASAINITQDAVASSELGYISISSTLDDLDSHYCMFGFSNGNLSVSYDTIDFAFYNRVSYCEVWESGANKATSLARNLNQVCEVRVDSSGTVTYYINNAVVYTSLTTATFPLLVDIALYRLTTNQSVLYNLKLEGVPSRILEISKIQTGHFDEREPIITDGLVRHFPLDSNTNHIVDLDNLEMNVLLDYAYASVQMANNEIHLVIQHLLFLMI
jgi:hypothetical protein